MGFCGLLIFVFGFSSLIVAIFDGARPWVRPLATVLMIMAFLMMGLWFYMSTIDEKDEKAKKNKKKIENFIKIFSAIVIGIILWIAIMKILS